MKKTKSLTIEMIEGYAKEPNAISFIKRKGENVISKR